MIVNLFKNVTSNLFIYKVLFRFYGLNKYRSFYLCGRLGIYYFMRYKNLLQNDILILEKIISVEKSWKLEDSLIKRIKVHIALLKRINCYRGVRHAYFLPLHGQRTKTNAKTMKRNKL